MFPSAANIEVEENSNRDTSKSDSWLQSSSYQRQVPGVQYSEKPHKTNVKRRHKRPREKSLSPTTAPPEKRESSAEVYRIDTNNNPYIYKYGCIYEGDVAKFNQNMHIPILGCRGIMCLVNLDVEAMRRAMKKNRANRYFSKKNRLRISQPGAFIGDSAINTEDNRKPYVILQDGFVPSTAKALDPQPSENLQRIADLNRTVYDAPHDLKSWIELLQMHIIDKESEKGDQESPERRRFLMLERQLAVVERAVEKNSGNLRLRLLLTAMYQYATELIASGIFRTATSNSSSAMVETLWHKDKVTREWYDLVRVCPQFVNVWRGYLAHLRGRFALFGANAEAGPTSAFGRINAIYRRALDTLSGLVAGRLLSHQPTEDTADQTVDLLAEYCQWLAQTGFTERAFSIWQAVIEFVCFCPPHLNSKHYVSSIERRDEFQRFWTAKDRGVAFGVPGARGWADWYAGKRRAKEKPEGDTATEDILLGELEEDWSSSSSTADARWNQIVKEWNGVSEAAEDALLNFCNAPLDAFDSTASSTTNPLQPTIKTYQPGEGSLSNRRSRGLAWLGLERARESVGWLPADTTLVDPSTLEDVERQPRFEDIEPFLLEIHLDPRISDVNVLERRKQRLILLFLEFLGVWDSEVAKHYELPSELQQLYELSSVSFLQRQSISPRHFGSPWLRSGPASEIEGSKVHFRMRSVLVASSLEQASHLFPNDIIWQSTIGRLKFGHLAGSINTALANKLLNPKGALALWRKKAKSILSTSPEARNDLSLWLAYAKGLSQTACVMLDNKSIFFAEARKVFTSTLRMYPIPTLPETPGTADLEQHFNVLLPRLKILHAFLELELGVNFPFDSTQALSHSECFARALHLINYVATGGAFTPLMDDQFMQTTYSALTDTANKLVQRLKMMLVLTPVSRDRTPSLDCISPIADLAAILGSLLVYFQLLTLGEDKMGPVCGMVFSTLRKIDNNGGDEQGRAKSDGVDNGKIAAGYASRRFLRLALPAISAVSVLSQRNRTRLTENFLRLMSEFFDNETLPLLTSPLEWVYLLPFKVAVNCGAYVSKTCSIEYQRSLQGLLPPLILSSLESRLNDSVSGVCRSVAHYLTTTCHRATMKPRPCFEGSEEMGRAENPTHLLGLHSGQQTELMARLLPSSMDLLCVGLELEHWTSLIAGATDNSTANPLSHCWIRSTVPRIRNAFEKALSTVPSNPILRLGSADGAISPLALTMTPSFWTDHLRIILWSTYMAFEWTLAGVSASAGATASAVDNFDAHRKQRTAFKAIFYRAVEDMPWAKVLYTDLARYCPEDAEEVVDLLTSKELRLRTFMEEVDLLLTSRIP